MSTSCRRRSLLEMLVCVLLVSALVGQPAWGEGKRGHRNAGATATKKARPSAKLRKRAVKPRQAGAPATPAANVPAVASNESNAPDPTPPPANDPGPVDAGPTVAVAPAEAGSGTPSAPGTQTPAAAVTAATSTPPEHGAPDPGSNSASTAAATTESTVVPKAQQETPVSDTAPKTVTALVPSAAPSPTPAAPTEPGATVPATGPLPATGNSPGSAAGASPPNGTAAGGSRTPAGAAAALAGASAASPIGGPVLSPATRDIVVTTSRGTSASRPSRQGDHNTIGSLGVPKDLGFSHLTNIVKDIPTWIWLLLAGLAALVLLLGAYTVLAAARTRRLERQRSKLMEDIGLLQAALLPAVPGRLGALLTTVAYRPADGPGAGGDFYDAFALSDGRVGLLLGDISGHGRQALAKTTLVRFTVRAHLEAGLSPREALAISGRSLDGRLSDDFSTVIAAIHDPVKGTLTYASAGHPPPLVVGPHAHEPVTASSAPPIGAGFPTGQRQTVLPMPEGTTVCVYSDGLLEARIDGEALGRERLADWLQELGPEASAKALLDLVVQRADRVPDDLAACVLHAAPGATAPAARVEQLKLDVLDVEGPELEGFLKACGVARADRTITGRRVAEQLAVSGGVVVEVRIGEHPMVSVASIGDHTSASRPPQRTH